jgi:DNA-binding TFAR19-related protein (PDSD5 family)
MDVDKVQEVSGMRAQQLQQEGGIATGDPQASEASQRREAEETRRDILATLLEPAARERRAFPLLLRNNFTVDLIHSSC